MVSMFVSTGRTLLFGDASQAAVDNRPAVIVIDGAVDIVFSFSKLLTSTRQKLFSDSFSIVIVNMI